MGVYGYSFNNSMYPSAYGTGYGTGYGGGGYGMGYGGGASSYAMPSMSYQSPGAYASMTQPYMGGNVYGATTGGGLAYPQGQMGYNNLSMTMPQTMGMQSASVGYNPFSSVTYPTATSYYAAPAMSTPLTTGSAYGMIQQPVTGTGFNAASYYPASGYSATGQMGGMNPFMQTPVMQSPQYASTNGYGGYPSAQPGLPMQSYGTQGSQAPNMLQMMNPAYSSLSSFSGPSLYGQVPGATNPQAANPFMQTPGLSMPPSMNAMAGGGGGHAGLPTANQLPTREELIAMLQYVDAINGEPGRSDALLYEQDPMGQYDPSMYDPSMMDPNMMDPSMMDPSMMDPSMYEDPAMAGEGFEPQNPNVESYGQRPGGPYGGYQAAYSDPVMYDSAYTRPGQVSPSLYNSSPLNQATAQFRDTMNPNFAMGGELTQDAKDQKEADKNKGGTPAAAS